jgi:hypothetical protein
LTQERLKKLATEYDTQADMQDGEESVDVRQAKRDDA